MANNRQRDCKIRKQFKIMAIVLFFTAAFVSSIASYSAFEVGHDKDYCHYVQGDEPYDVMVDGAKCVLLPNAFIEPLWIFILAQMVFQIPLWTIYFFIFLFCKIRKRNIDHKRKLLSERTIPLVDELKVYVVLLEEGTDTIRPTNAVGLGNGLYKLLPTNDYDPEDEIWEFVPGSIVKLKWIQTDGGEEILLAYEQVAEFISSKP